MTSAFSTFTADGFGKAVIILDEMCFGETARFFSLRQDRHIQSAAAGVESRRHARRPSADNQYIRRYCHIGFLLFS